MHQTGIIIIPVIMTLSIEYNKKKEKKVMVNT